MTFESFDEEELNSKANSTMNEKSSTKTKVGASFGVLGLSTMAIGFTGISTIILTAIMAFTGGSSAIVSIAMMLIGIIIIYASKKLLMDSLI